MRLVEPSVEYRESYLEALAEYHAEGRYFDRDAERLAADFAGFVRGLRERADPEKTRVGWVPDTVLWLVDGERYIGRVSIRHHLNEDLRIVGGHIGYDVRPSARRRGYGTRLLALALERARTLGLREVLLTCDATNDASRRIIERNGGRFEDEIAVPGRSVPVLRFWISIPLTI